MVLGDLLLVDQYISADITDINLYKKEQWDSKPIDFKLIIQDKLDFRSDFAQKVGITRLDYMIRVLRAVLGKASIADPDEYKARVKNLEKSQQAAALGLKRVGSSSSFGTMYSKSQKTGLTGGSSVDGGESTQGGTEKENADA